MLQALQTIPHVEDASAEGEMLQSFLDPARLVLYEPRKGEQKQMHMYVSGGRKLVMGWLSDENKGTQINSSTFRNVRTPNSSDRAEPNLWSLEMVATEESLQSRMLVSHPSVEIGTRVLFVGQRPSCVQLVTVVDFSPVCGSVFLSRIELVVSNTHYGHGEAFPCSDSTSESQYHSRSGVPLIEKSFKIGSDHALLVLTEGQTFWNKKDDTLFACLVLDATDPLHPLCMLSKDSPGTAGFGDPFVERINMLEKATGASLFTVSKSQLKHANNLRLMHD